MIILYTTFSRINIAVSESRQRLGLGSRIWKTRGLGSRIRITRGLRNRGVRHSYTVPGYQALLFLQDGDQP
jgi:hypothetical protein